MSYSDGTIFDGERSQQATSNQFNAIMEILTGEGGCFPGSWTIADLSDLSDWLISTPGQLFV